MQTLSTNEQFSFRINFRGAIITSELSLDIGSRGEFSTIKVLTVMWHANQFAELNHGVIH